MPHNPALLAEDLWGRMASGAAIGNRRASRVPLGPQVANLPHNLKLGHAPANCRNTYGRIPPFR